jgi:hypothetical protein
MVYYAVSKVCKMIPYNFEIVDSTFKANGANIDTSNGPAPKKAKTNREECISYSACNDHFQTPKQGG